MANLRVATAVRQAQCDAVTTLINAGSGPGVIEIRSGMQPANANAAASGTLLATLTFSDPAFGAANSSGVATASAIADATAAANGTASWARVKDSEGNTVFDCDVGTSGATINLNSTSITAGGTVSITSFTLTQPDGA